MKIIIVIPVFNERKNLTNLFKKIRKYNKYDILYVNDNSTDGTTQEILKIKKRFKNIYHMNRKKKSGIGSAHKDGISWCYKKKYDLIITMDGDGTHHPKYIKKIISKNIKNDITITNRFLKKNSLKTWPLLRVLITKLRHLLIKMFLGMDFDASGAFRCINMNRVNLIDLLSTRENDYIYFWKSIYKLSKKYRINEIPIDLPSRELGHSKMRINDIFKSLISLILFTLKQKF
tara:strand:+ start:881 stop:1576 length:696 start_codon:yes stop_codon:yes gene_type:complete